MRRWRVLLLVGGLILGWGLIARGQDLSQQVLLLLARVNTWTANQTFTNLTITGTCTGCGGAGGGTVWSVALTAPAAVFDVGGSPIVGAGTLALTFDTQTNNLVWAGPAVAPAAAPTFRALVDADIPNTITVEWASIDKTVSSLADLTTKSASDLSTGTLPAGRFPILTGDVTTPGGSLATTLANSGVAAATYGSATQIPQIVVDAKGRITAASNLTPTLAASTITSGQVGLVRGGSGADLSATGGVNQIVRQNGAGAVLTVSTLADADVPDTITIAGTNNVTWASVNKTGSSLADLATRSASDLASGALPLARLADDGTAGLPLLSGGAGGDPAYGATLAWAQVSKTGSSLADLITRSASDLSSGALALARLADDAASGLPLLSGGAGGDPAYVALAWAAIDKATSSLADITTRSAGDLNSGGLALARLTDDNVNTGRPLVSGGAGGDANYAATLGWALVSKTGSSLVDFDTRSAADLSSGALALARLTDGATAGQPLRAGGGGGDPAYGAVDLSTTDATGVLAAARFPALTGDVTTVAGALAATLANSGVVAAAYGSTSTIPTFTVDAKGRLTVAASVTPALPATAISSGQLALARAGTNADLSATGGANQFVRQSGAGSAFTVSAILDADIPNTITIDGTNNVTWVSVNKTGSSLADLVTKSAAALTSGSLADARLSANVPLLDAVVNTFTGYMIADSFRPTDYWSVGSTLPTAGAGRLQKGAALNWYAEAAADFHGIVSGSKNLTDAATNDLFEVAIPANSMGGGTITFTIVAEDGADYQARTGFVTYSAIDDAGVLTATVTEGTAAAGLEVDAFSGGTLTDVWAIVDGVNKITIRLTPTSSLVPTTLRIYYTVVSHAPHAVTVL